MNGIPAPAQTACDRSLLDSLTAALFPANLGMVSVDSFLERKPHQLDTVYLVRRNQPSLQAVSALLVQFAYQKDYECAGDLMKLYEAQQAYFTKEWEPLYLKYHFNCQMIHDQLSIIGAFEEVLHALQIGKAGYSPAALEAYYKRYLGIQYRFYYGKREGESFEALSDSLPVYSAYIKSIHGFTFGGSYLPNFNHIAPYIGEFDEQLIVGLSPYFEQADSISAKINLENFLLQNTCRVIGYSKNASYKEKVLDCVLRNQREPVNKVFMHVIDLWRNPHYRDNMKPHLIAAAGTASGQHQLNALRSLSCYHDMDVLQLYRKRMRQPGFSEMEKEIISIHLGILANQKAATHKLKRKGKLLMDKLKRKPPKKVG